MSGDDLAALMLAIAVAAYLAYALLFPEKL